VRPRDPLVSAGPPGTQHVHCAPVPSSSSVDHACSGAAAVTEPRVKVRSAGFRRSDAAAARVLQMLQISFHGSSNCSTLAAAAL
jgi:hypothetical protein